MSLIQKELTQFAVIGLGRFGTALTKTLYESGYDVLAVDIDPDKVNAISDFCTHAAITDCTDEAALKTLGLSNFDAAIICMGNNVQSSVLTTLACKEMNVPFIVCKANSRSHKKILEKLGANYVVVPEEDTAKKLALKLTRPHMNDLLELTRDFSIAEIEVPDKWSDKTLLELDLRNRYGIIILLVKGDDNKVLISPGGDCVLRKGNVIVIGGRNGDIRKLTDRI